MKSKDVNLDLGLQSIQNTKRMKLILNHCRRELFYAFKHGGDAIQTVVWKIKQIGMCTIDLKKGQMVEGDTRYISPVERSMAEVRTGARR